MHEHILERMQERVEANPELMKKRKQIVEHPFGTIKHWNDQGYFLMKGLKKVRAEMSLSALAYNKYKAFNKYTWGSENDRSPRVRGHISHFFSEFQRFVLKKATEWVL